MERKKHILRSLNLTEVSAVDNPAQEGAGVLIRKNHMTNDNLSTILAEAEQVVSKGARPTSTRAQAESAMLDLAKREARDGEGVCNAYARLCTEDERMQKLYALSEAADMLASEEAAQIAKRATRNERVWELMVKGAHNNRRAGETVEKALDRLLQTDKTYQDAYQLYCE